MKAITIVESTYFDLKSDKDKYVGAIICLLNDGDKVNVTNIRRELSRCMCITGFLEDTGEMDTYSNMGLLDNNVEEHYDEAIKIFNKMTEVKQ